MEEVIAITVLAISFLGLVLLFLIKIPVLVSLPQEPVESFTKKFFRKTKEKIKEVKIFQRSFWDLLLEKSLRRVRILSMKIDSKIFNWLKKKKEKEIKEQREENYWDKIKEELK